MKKIVSALILIFCLASARGIFANEVLEQEKIAILANLSNETRNIIEYYEDLYERKVNVFTISEYEELFFDFEDGTILDTVNLIIEYDLESNAEFVMNDFDFVDRIDKVYKNAHMYFHIISMYDGAYTDSSSLYSSNVNTENLIFLD